MGSAGWLAHRVRQAVAGFRVTRVARRAAVHCKDQDLQDSPISAAPTAPAIRHFPA